MGFLAGGGEMGTPNFPPLIVETGISSSSELVQDYDPNGQGGGAQRGTSGTSLIRGHGRGRT